MRILLDIVHGVRMPTNQFGRTLPSTLPISTNRAPTARGSTRETSTGRFNTQAITTA